MGEDFCTASLLNQRLGAAALLHPSSVLSPVASCTKQQPPPWSADAGDGGCCLLLWCCAPWTSAWSQTPTAMVVLPLAGVHAVMAVLPWHLKACWALLPRKIPNFLTGFSQQGWGVDASGRAAIWGASAGSVVKRVVCNQLA